MILEGIFKKMTTEWHNPIQYYLECKEDWAQMNQLIGREIHIKHTGYECFNCKEDNAILAMGYCFKCFKKVPQTQPFILKPELSKAHLGIEEIDLEFEKKLQLRPHIVYLANTGAVKVGVTRKTQVPTRWIDQGASFALPILEVENRYLAGISEVAIAKYISDKTNYRKMLTGQIPDIDLIERRNELQEYLPVETKNSVLHEEKVLEINYPIETYPEKIKSITLKKNKEFKGVLTGIKGQYLILDQYIAFNIRNHEGYAFELEL